MKYYAEITGWGDEAKAFLKELNYIILFNDNAPSELAEISLKLGRDLILEYQSLAFL